MSLELLLSRVQKLKSEERALAWHEDQLTLRQQTLAHASPAAHRARRGPEADSATWSEAFEARERAMAARRGAVQAWTAALDSWQAELESAQRAVARADEGSVESLRARITSMLAAEVGELSAAELAELVDRALGRASASPAALRPPGPEDSGAGGGVDQEAELVAAWAEDDPADAEVDGPRLEGGDDDALDDDDESLGATPTPGALNAAEVDGPVGQDELDLLVSELRADDEDAALESDVVLEPEPELEHDPILTPAPGALDLDEADASAALLEAVDDDAGLAHHEDTGEDDDVDPFAALLDEADPEADEWSAADQAQAAALSVEIDVADMVAVLDAAEAEQAADMTGRPSSLSEALAAALAEEISAAGADEETDPVEQIAAGVGAAASSADGPGDAEEDPGDDPALADMFARLEHAESALDADDEAEAAAGDDDPWAELEAQLETREVSDDEPEPARVQQRLPEMDELDSLSPDLVEAVRNDLLRAGDLGLGVDPIAGYDAAALAPGDADEFPQSLGQADLVSRGRNDPFDDMLADLDPPSMVPTEAQLAPARFAALGTGASANDPWATLDIQDLRYGGVPRPLPGSEPAIEVRTHESRERVERQARAQLAVKVGMEHGNAFFTGFSGNISSGGLFVATHQLLEIGSQLELFFEMPDGHEVSVVAEIRWRREYNPAATDQPPGMGLRFLNLGYDDQILIDRYIANHETIFYD